MVHCIYRGVTGYDFQIKFILANIVDLDEMLHHVAFAKITLDRWQSKMLLKVDERGSKIARNSVFGCHLSPRGRQMATENSVSNDIFFTFIDSIIIFDRHLSGVKILI